MFGKSHSWLFPQLGCLNRMTTTDLVHITHEFIPRLTPEVNIKK